MDEIKLRAACERTDAKLRYAEVHLQELKGIPTLNGSDFDRAHQESFLYHFVGVKEAFIQELNLRYNANLPERDLTAGKLRDYMKLESKPYTELTVIYVLEKDKNSCLSQAKNMRDHSTHITNVARAYHMGGEYDNQVHLSDPKTGLQIKQNYIELFDNWLSLMRALISDLRTTATRSQT